MLYGDTERILYQSGSQINGTNAHKTIDTGSYSTKKEMLTGIDVYCEEFRLIGKIDLYDKNKELLVERKRTVKKIYDGYIFQVYAQCLSLREMGYKVSKIIIHSLTDNKNYPIKLPEEDSLMFDKFKKTISDMHEFDMNKFEQACPDKCRNCIYEPACDRGIN